MSPPPKSLAREALVSAPPGRTATAGPERPPRLVEDNRGALAIDNRGAAAALAIAQGLRLKREPRVAKLCDHAVAPLWTRRFGRLLLRRALGGTAAPSPAVAPSPAADKKASRAMLLDVMCGSGYPGLELRRRLGSDARLVAIDPSSALLDLARARAGTLAGRRVFFRSEGAEPTLPFAAEVYDVVLSNLGLWETAEPRRLLAELVRVTKPGGRVLATLPLAGTFGEVHRLLERELSRRELRESQLRLSTYLGSLPSAAEARSWMMEAGLTDVNVDCEEYTLLFAGGVDFFLAPVIEYGPLLRWKEVVGQAHLQEVFTALRESIDHEICRAPGEGPEANDAQSEDRDRALLLRWPRPFAVTVRAGCVSGRKPLPPEP